MDSFQIKLSTVAIDQLWCVVGRMCFVLQNHLNDIIVLYVAVISLNVYTYIGPPMLNFSVRMLFTCSVLYPLMKPNK